MPEDYETHMLMRWEDAKGRDNALLLVSEDEDAPGGKWLEHARKDGEMWSTEEKIENVDRITDFGMPERLLK